MISFHKNVFEYNTKLSDVLKKINYLKHKIILVTQKNKFFGVLTDGDIRRFFMKNISKDILIGEIANKNPIKLGTNYDKKDLSKSLSSQIRYIPVISKDKKISKLIDTHLLKKKKYKNHVFIIAGGLGSRLYPITKKIPKPMLMINKKPHLENVVDKLIEEGFQNITLCLNYKYENIISYFKKRKKKAEISYSIEKKRLGTAGPIRFGVNEKTVFPMIVINADLITDLKFSNLLNFQNNNKNALTVGVKREKYKLPFATVDYKKEKILSITEKPEKFYYFNTGIYMMNKDIIKLIPKNKKFDMPDLISKTLSKKKIVTAFYIYENWYDFGTRENYNMLKK